MPNPTLKNKLTAFAVALMLLGSLFYQGSRQRILIDPDKGKVEQVGSIVVVGSLSYDSHQNKVEWGTRWRAIFSDKRPFVFSIPVVRRAETP